MRLATLGVATVTLCAAVVCALKTPRLAAAHAGTTTRQYAVKIDNFSFEPATLTVPAGATVTWTNEDDVPHTVTGTSGRILRSPVLDTGDKFSFTFTKRGAYPYYCSVHPRMVAKVVVQ